MSDKANFAAEAARTNLQIFVLTKLYTAGFIGLNLVR